MQICSVSAEVAPWSKTGGLGDVAGALPVALAARGHQVMGVAPRYRDYPEAWDTMVRLRFGLFGGIHEVGLFHARVDGVERVFVDHPSFHRSGVYGDARGGYGDNLFRFALLARAAIEAARQLPGVEPLRFLFHDWHASLLPLYLHTHYQPHGMLTDAKTALVIHNLAHQGVYAGGEFEGLDLPHGVRPDLDMHGNLNLLKAGIVAADRVLTVSPTYADEIRTSDGGCGLDSILRARGAAFSGIVNGADTTEWNPATDPHITASYDRDDFSGKALCKLALQRELGLPVRADVPLISFVGRLDPQKGVDLITEACSRLMLQPVQLVMLGTGRPEIEAALRWMQGSWPEQVRGLVGFDVPLAHRIMAGSDLMLMPSRFEPCGLNQLYGLAYGTVPIVRATGGLADTVRAHHPGADDGTGWLFGPATADALLEALGWAIYTWHVHPEEFRRVQLRGMAEDVGWDKPAATYEAVLASM